jgi:hypothetical protein
MTNVNVTVVAEGVSGLSKRAGRAPRAERLEVIAERFGSMEAYSQWEKSATKEQVLVARDEISRETQKRVSFAKNGGKPGLIGRAPSDSRVQAVSRLTGKGYAEFRASLTSLSDLDRHAWLAKVDALATLIDAGVRLSDSEYSAFCE